MTQHNLTIDFLGNEYDYCAGTVIPKKFYNARVLSIYYDHYGLPYEVVCDASSDENLPCRVWVKKDQLLGDSMFPEDISLSKFDHMVSDSRSGVRTKNFLLHATIDTPAGSETYLGDLIAPFSVHNRCNYFSPKANEETDELYVGIFLSSIDKERNKRSWLKPGRAFRRMFPELTDAQLEILVDKYRKAFTPANLNLTVSDLAEDFQFAYASEHAPYQNPCTTESRKSLANSCMRYEFDNLDCHPAEAYASGEFKILYTTAEGDESLRIHSRCVVWCPPEGTFKVWQAAPVYGVSEAAIDKIEEYLNDNGATLFGDGAKWDGARLRAIKSSCGAGYIAPYLDVNPRALDVSDDGKYLVVAKYGEIDASDYSGILGGYQYSCEECGEGLHEEDTHWDPDGNYCYCDHCFSQNFVMCYESDEYIHSDNAVEVHVNQRGRTELVHQDCLDNYIYIESREEFWHYELVETNVEDSDPSYYFVIHLDLSDYTYVESEGCWYLKDRAPLDEQLDLDLDGIEEQAA